MPNNSLDAHNIFQFINKNIETESYANNSYCCRFTANNRPTVLSVYCTAALTLHHLKSTRTAESRLFVSLSFHSECEENLMKLHTYLISVNGLRFFKNSFYYVIT